MRLRSGYALLLAFALLLGQQAAWLHAFVHAAEPLQAQGDGHSQPPAPADCPEHSWYVPFAGAVGSCAAIPPPVAPSAVSAARIGQEPVPLPARYSFLTRAPPASPA